MLILLLSARPDLAPNRRLQEAATELGASLEVVDATRVVAGVGAEPSLRFGGRELLEPLPGAVIARIGNWRPESLLAQLEIATSAGLASPNPAPAIRIARDHWQTVQRLSADDIPVAPTMAAADPEELARVAIRRFSLPVVVKTRRSRMGVGVILCRTADHLECVLDSLWRVGEEMIVQQFVSCRGESKRLLVIRDRVVAAARFRARDGEWRSNAARGGSAEADDPSASEIELAVGAARSLGLGLCGVDLFPGDSGVVVGEVNPTPGFMKLEQATGIDVARLIVEDVISEDC